MLVSIQCNVFHSSTHSDISPFNPSFFLNKEIITKVWECNTFKLKSFPFLLLQLCSVCSGRWVHSPQEIPIFLLWQQLAWFSGWRGWCSEVSLLWTCGSSMLFCHCVWSPEPLLLQFNQTFSCRYDPAEMLCAVFWENSYSDMLIYILSAFSVCIFLPFLFILLCSLLSAFGYYPNSR